jgi:type IV secretory pathway VirB2 component (pilin)
MKILSKMKNKVLSGSLATLMIVSGSSFADGNQSTPNLTQLTDSVDFGGVLTAIMAIAASLITLYAGYVGVRWVLRMVKGA